MTVARLLLWGMTGGLWAGEGNLTYLPAAQVSQAWLGIATDPRAAAMGEALVAEPSPGFPLRSNPAGLSLLFDSQLSFAHNEWNPVLGLRQEYLGFSRRLGEAGGLGVALNYFSYGSFEDRDAQGAPIPGGPDSAYALGLGLANAFQEDRLQVGLCVEAAQETLGSRLSSAYTAGLGMLWQLAPWLRLGAFASSFGIRADEGQAPMVLHAGLAAQPFRRALLLTAQASRPQKGTPSFRFGAEWNLAGMYRLRAGWRAAQDPAEPDQGLSLGAGLNLGALNLDYAYVPYGELSRSHRLAATLEISEGLFGGPIVIESQGSTQNAQAEYAQGKAAFERRDWYVAKVSLNRALKASPGFPEAPQAGRLLDEIERRIAAEKSRGLTPEVRHKLSLRVGEAAKRWQAADYAGARRELEAVLEFDAGHKEAQALLARINAGMAARAEELRQEAFSALSRGELAAAVLRYRQLLKMDSSDPEAKARMAKLRPGILAEAKRLHRQGIEHYLGSDFARAVSVWERALELEPSDPHNIRRDLEKARRLLELRSSK